MIAIWIAPSALAASGLSASRQTIRKRERGPFEIRTSRKKSPHTSLARSSWWSDSVTRRLRRLRPNARHSGA